ncbi:MAG: hypothetical protein L6Q33_10930 [Bacteriovoracaceae bacterium]|nr:hypothetical protein [Bacteriovoracaceae bacterium]
MYKLFLFLCIVLFLPMNFVQAQSAFENVLNRNQDYKEITEKLESKEWFNKGTEKVGEFLEKRKNEKPLSANEQAELYYQGNVSDKPCVHCPQYLNLVREVNKVVAKTKDSGESVEAYNNRMIELNKLKFLYFATREVNESGTESCQKWNSYDPLNKVELGGNTKLIAEEVLHMPNVTSIQYMPQGNEQDIYYYYRGEGAQKDVIIEVKMTKNGEGRVRYFKYTPEDEFVASRDLPDLGTPPVNSNNESVAKDDNYFDLKMDVKTRKLVLPTDVEFAEAGTTTELNENLKLKSKTNLAFNTQNTSMSLANSTGDDWLRVEAKNKTQGDTSFATTIPVEFNLNKESNLKLGGALSREMVRDFNKSASKFDNTNTVKLGLTDHNHEYLNAEVISKEEGMRNVALSSKYSLGEASNVSGKYEFDSEGSKKYTIGNETRYGDDSSITGKYEFDNKGNRAYSVGNKTNMGNYGTLTTSYGVTQERKQFIEFGHEKKISDSASMVLSVKTGKDQETTVMYQFQAKF